MTDITIENINGVPHTVVWHCHSTFDKQPLYSYYCGRLNDSSWVVFNDLTAVDHIATALPPLPRHPKPEHAELLHLYAAHSLIPVFTFSSALTPVEDVRDAIEEPFVGVMPKPGGYTLIKTVCRAMWFHPDRPEWNSTDNPPLTHAINKQGERVEVAIYD